MEYEDNYEYEGHLINFVLNMEEIYLFANFNLESFWADKTGTLSKRKYVRISLPIDGDYLSGGLCFEKKCEIDESYVDSNDPRMEDVCVTCENMIFERVYVSIEDEESEKERFQEYLKTSGIDENDYVYDYPKGDYTKFLGKGGTYIVRRWLNYNEDEASFFKIANYLTLALQNINKEFKRKIHNEENIEEIEKVQNFIKEQIYYYEDEYLIWATKKMKKDKKKQELLSKYGLG